MTSSTESSAAAPAKADRLGAAGVLRLLVRRRMAAMGGALAGAGAAAAVAALNAGAPGPRAVAPLAAPVDAPRASALAAGAAAEHLRIAEAREAELEALRASIAARPAPIAAPVSAEAQAARAAARDRLAEIAEARAEGSPAALTDLAQRWDLRALATRILAREEAAATVATLSVDYLDRHPALVAARAAQAEAAAAVEAELDRLERDARAALAKADAPAAPRAEAPEERARLEALSRQAKEARAAYEAAVSAAAPTPRTWTPPAPPQGKEPAALPLVFAASLLAAMAGGGAAAAGADRVERRIRTAADVEREIGLRVAASLPLLSARELRLVDPSDRHPAGFLLEKPMSSFADSLRSLRTAVIRAAPGRASRVVAVTSAGPGEGKSTCALALARTAAVSGQKVVLVDCDLRRRSLNEMLAIAPDRGVGDVLSGARAWRDVVARDEFSGCHVIPACETSTPETTSFAGPAMARLLEELTEAYQFVVLDGPPALMVADTRSLAAQAHVVVLVARARRTGGEALKAAVAEIAGAGDAPPITVALNAVPAPAQGLFRFARRDGLNRAYARYFSPA